MKDYRKFSRRQMLKLSGAAFTALNFSALSVFASDEKRKYRIGACDWSIRKKNNIDAIRLTKKIGLEGIQLSLGDTTNIMSLWHQKGQQAFQEAAKTHNVSICSLALAELNKVPYKSDPVTEEWVSNSIDVAHAVGTNVVLLAFFGKGDIKGDKAGTKEVIKRLKKVAPKAEKAGVILGIESWLSADEHLDIIDAVGSSNIRVYYDVANSHKMGYDIYSEMSRLGKEFICEIHAKENNALLGDGDIDFLKVKRVLDNMDYEGWINIEGAVPKGADIFNSYVANKKYLQSVLNAS